MSDIRKDGTLLRILISGNQVSHLGFDEATEDTDNGGDS